MIPGLSEPRYILLKAEEAGSALNNGNLQCDAELPGPPTIRHAISRTTRVIYGLVLAASLIANTVLAIALHNTRISQQSPQQSSQHTPQPACQTLSTPVSQQPKLEKTIYAGLEYNKNSTWEFDTPYAQENVTAADEEWMAMDISNAFVALTTEHAQQMGLPRSIPFPWDARQKELYLISSIHSIHCLTVLHRSNLEYRTSHTQTYSTEHILHCLDNLRVDIQCSADDTPRFIPPEAAESTAKTGVGQVRQCRDWSKLNGWAKEHDACFSYNQFLYQELSNNKVYPLAWQFCDKDSKYTPIVQKFLGKDSNWVAPRPGWPDIDQIQQHN